MGSGSFSNLLLELAGLDIAESLVFLVGKDKQVRLRCAYADFGITNGVATARARGAGHHRHGTWCAATWTSRRNAGPELVPRPKDFSPLSIRAPINISGTFADPVIGPSGKLVLRGAAVAALVSIAPPLALLGPGRDRPWR